VTSGQRDLDAEKIFGLDSRPLGWKPALSYDHRFLLVAAGFSVRLFLGAAFFGAVAGFDRSHSSWSARTGGRRDEG